MCTSVLPHEYMCIHTYTLIKINQHSNTGIHKKLDSSPIIIGKDCEQVLYTSISDKNDTSLAVTTHVHFHTQTYFFFFFALLSVPRSKDCLLIYWTPSWIQYHVVSPKQALVARFQHEEQKAGSSRSRRELTGIYLIDPEYHGILEVIRKFF